MTLPRASFAASLASAFATAAACSAFLATGARADDAIPKVEGGATTSPVASQGQPLPPPELLQSPRWHAQIQYGVAFTVEGVASAGPICPGQSNPCILGSGGGVVIRVGWRPTERFYLGGAYGFSKQDPNQLYRLGILQQARAELRYYVPTGHSVSPYGLAGMGIAAYGNEWQVDTWGPSATLGAGIELELTGGAVLGVSLAYRPIYLQSFTDSSTIFHDSGLAHFVGLELALEAQDAL